METASDGKSPAPRTHAAWLMTSLPRLQTYGECLCRSALVKASSRRASLLTATFGRLSIYAVEDNVLLAAALWA